MSVVKLTTGKMIPLETSYPPALLDNNCEITLNTFVHLH
jgi:hypothetical protein